MTRDAPQTTCTGDVTIKGKLRVDGFSALSNGVKVTVARDSHRGGYVTATGDLKAGNIRLRNHPHGEIKREDEKSRSPATMIAMTAMTASTGRSMSLLDDIRQIRVAIQIRGNPCCCKHR